LFDFQIAETKTFAKSKQKISSKLYQKITKIVYPQLRNNPYFGPNIKKLKGQFEGFYRYRIGNHRLFYLIDDKKVIVFIIDFKQRKDAYKK
jgi:mRNA interferase RelE/StbE